MRLYAGVDVGSCTTKAVIIDQEGEMVGSHICRSGMDYQKAAKEALESALNGRDWDNMPIFSSGYGRHSVDFASGAKTEIACHARGGFGRVPRALTLVDIGGQDTKAILLDGAGRVSKFEMNDRCAAGTGMFLEVIAKTLGYDLEEFGKEALKAQGNIQINSMCTVFAQSEVTSLLARRQKREDIARGIHMAILNRTLSLLKRVSTTPDVVFAGGVARNPCIKRLLGDALGCEVRVPEDPQMVGAYGAALVASEAIGHHYAL